MTAAWKKSVRLVLFDVDGTLTRTGGAGIRAFAKVFSTEFGAHDGTERMKFSGRTDVGLVREFLNMHGIPATPANFQRFFERYAFWLDQMMQQSQGHVCEGVWEFIACLRALRNPPMLGLLTGNIRLGAEIKLRHFNLWQEFETGAFADDAEDRNEIAAVALERGRRVLDLSLRPEEVVVVGDTPLDIRCARAIGARMLAVATGNHPLAELRDCGPDWAVENLLHMDARSLNGSI